MRVCQLISYKLHVCVPALIVNVQAAYHRFLFSPICL